MNSKNTLSVKGILFGAVSGTLGGLICIFVPGAAFAMPIVLGCAFVLSGAWSFAACAAAAMAVAAAAGGWQYAAIQAVSMLPAGFTIGFVVSNRHPWRRAVCIAALFISVAFYIDVCLPSMLAGEEPFFEVKEAMRRAITDVVTVYKEAGADADMAATLAAILSDMVDSVPRAVMIITCGLGMGFGLFDTLLVRVICRKKRELRPMAPFILWNLSKQYTYIGYSAIAGIVVCLIARLDNTDAIIAAAGSVIMMPLMLNGVCHIEFAAKVDPKHAGVKRLVYWVFSLLLFPYALAILGIMDRVTKMRMRFVAADNKDDGEDK